MSTGQDMFPAVPQLRLLRKVSLTPVRWAKLSRTGTEVTGLCVLNRNTCSQHQTQRNFNIYFSYLHIMGPGMWLCQSAECLPRVHEAWGPSPAPHKLNIVVYVCNPSPCEEAGGSGVQGHPHLQSKFKTSLDYMRPVYKTKAKLIYCHNLLVWSPLSNIGLWELQSLSSSSCGMKTWLYSLCISPCWSKALSVSSEFISCPCDKQDWYTYLWALWWKGYQPTDTAQKWHYQAGLAP